MALPRVAAADATSTVQRAPYVSYPFFPQIGSGTYSTETVQEIVSNILTWAYFEVSAATAILTTPSLASLVGVSSGLPQAFLQAFDVELQSHIDFWASIAPGANPKATTFTIDPSAIPNSSAAAA